MPDEKQALETAKFIKVESSFNNGSIEKATAELKLDTYKQIQNCFIGFCMFFGLVALAMQHSDLHKDQALVRHTLLHSPTDFAAVETRYQNNRDYEKLAGLYNARLAESERKFGSDSTLLIPVISQLAALNTQLDRLPEAELLYKRSQALIQKYNQEQDKPQ